MASISESEVRVRVTNRHALQALTAARDGAKLLLDEEPDEERFKCLVKWLDEALDGLDMAIPPQDEE